MAIHFTSGYRMPRRSRAIWRHLVSDILPTLLLLLAMAAGMAWVAHYADSSHADPGPGDGQVAKISSD